MRILIIEDEAKTVNYLRKGLSEHGFTVDVATDGEDGLHLALTETYDLIVLDVMLPGRSGWEIIEELRRWGMRRRPYSSRHGVRFTTGFMARNWEQTIIW